MWQDRGVEIILDLLILMAVAGVVIGVYLFTKQYAPRLLLH
jgi:hypothetical protein